MITKKEELNHYKRMLKSYGYFAAKQTELMLPDANRSGKLQLYTLEEVQHNLEEMNALIQRINSPKDKEIIINLFIRKVKPTDLYSKYEYSCVQTLYERVDFIILKHFVKRKKKYKR